MERSDRGGMLVGSGVRVGVVWGMGYVNQELKVLLNVHKGIVQY